jgi:hypothetical protein
MQTVFTQAMRLGAPTPLAAGLQVAAAAVAAAIVAVVWRSKRDVETKFAVLTACAPFATPYLYGYDMCLLILPIVWLARRGAPLPWERLVIGCAFVSPLFSVPLAGVLGFNSGVVVNALLLACVLRRVAWTQQAAPSQAAPREVPSA